MGKLGEYHEHRHLPVWSAGNAYLGGAKAWKHEKNALVSEDAQVRIELVEEDGKYRLETNLFDVIGDYAGGVITSDTLGRAFEPDQRFESPDGSAITFDSDYFGNHRGLRAAPGPFAGRESLEAAVW